MDTSQQRAIRKYRAGLGDKGLARFEVLGRETDRDLIRTLARRLAEDSSDAAGLRIMLAEKLTSELPEVGGILLALRRSPLVGEDVDFERPFETGRRVEF